MHFSHTIKIMYAVFFLKNYANQLCFFFFFCSRKEIQNRTKRLNVQGRKKNALRGTRFMSVYSCRDNKKYISNSKLLSVSNDFLQQLDAATTHNFCELN